MKSEKPMIEMADGSPLPTDAPVAATGHPGERLEQPIPADPIPVRDPSAPAPVAADARAVEHWAKVKGMLPQFLEGKKPPTAPAKAKPPQIHNPKFAHFHGAKHGKGWPIGMELTEAEFDAAIAETQAHVYR